MKRTTAILILTMAFAALYGQSGLRSISTLDSYVYEDGTYRLNCEEVLLVPLAEKLILNTRLTLQFSDYAQRYLLQEGIVYIWGPGLYSEAVYGPALDNEGRFSHEGYGETTFERERFLLSMRIKAGFYPENDLWFLIPDTSGLYRFSPLYTLKGQYFFAVDSENVVSHSLKSENHFTLNDRWRVDLTLSGTLRRNGNWLFSHEIGLMAHYSLAEKHKLRYFTNYINKDESTRGWQNSLTLDAMF